MSGASVSTIAYYLVLIGGILMVLFGLLGLIADFGSFIYHWGFSYGGIVTLVMGVIAIIGSRTLKSTRSLKFYGLI